MQLADVLAADDLAVAALWLASQDAPQLDVDSYVHRLDALGEALRLELRGVCDADRVTALARFMAERLPLQVGPVFHMDETMDTGRGIQMLCCAVWVSVAQRAGLDAFGLDVPGWFLARIAGTVVDVASGGVVLSDEDARGFVNEKVEQARAAGVSLIQADPSLIDPEEIVNRRVTVSAFLVRLNRNLVSAYTRLANQAAARERMFR